MTNREFYTAVINNEITDEVINFANESLVKMDNRNARRVEKNADKHSDEKSQILAVLTETPQLASEIATAVGMTTAKVSGLLSRMDNIVVGETKVKGGKRKVYSIA